VKLERFQKILAVTLALGGLGWWFFEHVSMAQGDHEEQITLVEAVEKLTSIHIRQATVAQAEAAQLDRLCREGKIDPRECPGLPTRLEGVDAVITIPVPAPPPVE